MLFLNMATSLTGEEKEKIRKEVKERTGEDCCILPPYITRVDSIPVKKDGQPPCEETAPPD